MYRLYFVKVPHVFTLPRDTALREITDLGNNPELCVERWAKGDFQDQRVTVPTEVMQQEVQISTSEIFQSQKNLNLIIKPPALTPRIQEFQR